MCLSDAITRGMLSISFGTEKCWIITKCTSMLYVESDSTLKKSQAYEIVITVNCYT